MLTVAELKPVLPLPRLRSQRKGGYGIPQTANDTCASYAEFGRRPSPPAVAAKTSRPIFSPLELLVIGIGASDRRTFIKPESRLGRLQQLLFGIEAPLPFADQRLEALRRLALALRRHGRSSDAEAALALQAGVTSEQIQHLRSGR